jgi:hypothetical protein
MCGYPHRGLCHIVLVLLVLFGVTTPLVSAPIIPPNARVAAFPGLGVDTLYALPDRWIVGESVTVRVDSVLWQLDVHYWLEPPGNQVRFYRIVELSETVEVRYRVLPFTIQDLYYRRDLSSVATVTDSGVQSEVAGAKPVRAPLSGIGSDLRRSGSLVRGISVGTDRDLEIESGLRLQIEGKVGTNVDVLAVLSDQSTPIEPEGTTQTLEEIDKVYVEVASSQMRATLGDFQLYLPGGRWSCYSRKLTGARGEGWTDWGKLTVTGAVSEGEFHSNGFYGQEGNQGPYQLVGKEGQTGIRVLAGSEHVWIDGQAMVRGDTRDYVIEYGNGEITFTSNRLVSGDSRILVDFEYAPDAYRRSYYSAQSVGEVGDSLLTVTGTFLYEGDDPSSPLGLAVSEDDRQALEMLGDQEGGAWISGVDSVGMGEGLYVYADTTLDDSTYRILQWVGRDSLDNPLGYLNVQFTQLSGDSAAYIRTYSSQGDLYYRWVGPGYGLYGPYRRLTPAKRHSLGDVTLEFKPLKRLTVTGELAFSDLDLNLDSPLDDGNNQGLAGEVSYNVNRALLLLGERSLGRVSSHGEYRRKDDQFRELSRSGVVEYNRYWGLAGAESPGEEVVEGDLTYEPVDGIAASGGYGRMDREDILSERYNGSVSAIYPEQFEGTLYQEWIDTERPDGGESSKYLRREGRAAYHYRIWHPLVFHRVEEEETIGETTWGTRFDENGGGVGIGTVWGMFLDGSVGLRQDQVKETTYYRDLSDTWTTNMGWRGDWGATFHGEADYTHRVRYFVESDSPDVKTDLGSVAATLSPWNRVLLTQVNYRLSNTRVAQLAIVAVEVDPGEGDYIEQNGVYVPDEEGDIRLETVPTGEYQPVTDLRTGLTIKVEPDRLPSSAKRRLGILPRLSTATQVDFQEQSRWSDLWEIVSYRPDVVQGDSTIYGRFSLRQDLYWDRTKSVFSVRLRGRLVESINRQYQLNTETASIREGSVWARRKLSQKFAGEWEITVRSEKRWHTGAGRVNRNIRRQSSWTDVSYRWAEPHDVGMGVGLARGEDVANNESYWAVEAEPHFTESLRGRGRLDFSVRWSHVESDNPTLSYELSEGLNPGDNFRWVARAMLHLGKNLTGSASYEGRSEPGEKVRHLGRMEVRAYF